MAIKILKVKDIVKYLLIIHPETRDNSQRLIVAYWNEQLIDPRFKELPFTVNDAFNLIASGELEHPESICRASRQLQMKYPDLRGANYKERYENQNKIKEELKQI